MINAVSRTIAVIACTVAFSATCVLSAVGPAQAAPTAAARGVA